MNGTIFMIEVNVSDDTREPERWVAMYQPCYSEEEVRRKFNRLANSQSSQQKYPRRMAKYKAVEVLK